MSINLKKITKNKTLIIAEGCDNHFGKLSNAIKMVKAAKKAGADVIKFQHHLPDEEMLRIVPKSKNFKISLYDFLKKYSLKIEDHYKIKKFCSKINIKYLCTPFSLKAAYELNRIGVQWFKIGSGEFTDTPFLKELKKLNKPIILSTGMSDLKEIDMIYQLMSKNYNDKIALMNCTSEYPPSYKDLNLGFITTMRAKYKKAIIGHSDHTNDIFTSLSAVSLGAKIIEKHVYLDNLNNGPDRDVSISFQQLKNLIYQIRLLEKALGNIKKVHRLEKKIRSWAHRSLVSTKFIKKNTVITKEDIWSKRPGIGIPSRYMNKIIGKTAKRDIKENILISKKDFK